MGRPNQVTVGRRLVIMADSLTNPVANGGPS